ncbi:cystathionine beta-lyase [Flagelloscypha sp. PMI_526]|nr:cystathionine beta-lyase [Flagelloscypha sp. PMI_526]
MSPPTIDSSVKHALHDLPTPDPDSPLRPRKPYRFSTLCATVENPSQKDQYGSSSVPIYQTATFKGVDGQYDYSRSGNPTRSHLEHHIAKISSAVHAFAVSSGMAALDIILRVLKPGDEVIAGDDLYGGTNRLLTYIRTHAGITVHHVDTTVPDALLPFILPEKTAMVLLESPTNPLLKIVDLAADLSDGQGTGTKCSYSCRQYNDESVSSTAARTLARTLSTDSATKYLSGHHDLMAGVITCNRDDVAKQMAFTINSVGNGLTPIDSFLLLRGTKTLAIRLDRQATSANAVAHYLDSLGFPTNYPGLPSHPNREVHEAIADGAGAVLSFSTGDKALSERIVGGTRLWGISVSFGCVNSLISMPCDLIRLYLLDDLEHALLDAGAIKYDNSVGKFVRRHAKLALEEETRDLPQNKEWLVSSPGKIILFGEHAVVHGVTAIAASVDLRCYGLVPTPETKDSAAPHGEQLDTVLLNALTDGPLKSLSDETQKHARTASQAFLYLYMMMAAYTPRRPSFNFTARATLPVGAGLGSSASFSVCASTALLLVFSRISIPPPPQPTDPATGHVHVSHQGRRALPSPVSSQVNHWAFVSEKVLHGNPSGVDNSVAVYGGALAYTRTGFSRKGGMEPISGFKSLKFMLTNSKVPRNTKELVAGVGRKKNEEPELVNDILDKIQSISHEAQRALADPELSRSELLSLLSSLISANHQHLVTLGVSHPSLEAIRSTTMKDPYNLSTKLTGAGGGGCSVTLLPDEVNDDAIAALIEELNALTYESYLTSVGGSGFGILSPYEHHRAMSRLPRQSLAGTMTPPSSPPADRESADPLGSGENESLRPSFEMGDKEKLKEWAESLGRWLYV